MIYYNYDISCPVVDKRFFIIKFLKNRMQFLDKNVLGIYNIIGISTR